MCWHVMTASPVAGQVTDAGVARASESCSWRKGGHMRKPFLKVWMVTVVCMLLPLQAFATICWTDNPEHPDQGNLYSVELGPSRGGKIALHGYVKIAPGAPCKLVGGIAPLFGTAVVVDSKTVVIGWQIISIDKDAVLDSGKVGCIGYRELLNLNPLTGALDGEYFFDSELPDQLSGFDDNLHDRLLNKEHLEIIACPSPQDRGHHNPLKRFDE